MHMGIYSLPKLKLIKEYTFADEKSESIQIKQVEFSRDGKLLFAAQQLRSTPHLFRADTWEEVIPYEGHAGKILSLRFSADGKSLQSIGADNLVRAWDVTTMKTLKRTPLPAGCFFAVDRPPDGRYVIVSRPDNRQQSAYVLDLTSCNVLCEVALPVNWKYTSTRLHWLNDQEALCTGDGRWCRFNFRTGNIIAEGYTDIDKENALFNGRGEITEDGKSILIVEGDIRSGYMEARKADVATMRSVSLGKIEPEVWPDGDFGLVPGGKYFHLGTQVYDRRTLKQISGKKFIGRDLLQVVFSPDGSCYAAVTGKRIVVDNDFRVWDSKTQSVLSIHDTLTGRTLFAFPASTRWIRHLAFSPDKRRLAIANDNGTLEVWALPDPPTNAELSGATSSDVAGRVAWPWAAIVVVVCAVTWFVALWRRRSPGM